MKIRKTCVAALCAVSLPLGLTACGSDGAEDAEDNAGNNNAGNNADNAAPQDNQGDQAGEGEITQAPVQGPEYKTAASEEDQQQIIDLLHGLSDGARPMDVYLNWTIDNTCRADIDQQGGEEAARQQAKDSAGQGNFDEQPGRTPNITDIKDVMAEGDNAHAMVTIVEGERSDTNRMYFKREDAKWKFCHTLGTQGSQG